MEYCNSPLQSVCVDSKGYFIEHDLPEELIFQGCWEEPGRRECKSKRC